MVVAVIFYAMAVIPNLKSSGNKKPKQKKYPLFYGDISALKLTKYRALMEKGTEKDFVDELIWESWTNSGICMRKMKLYKAGGDLVNSCGGFRVSKPCVTFFDV